MYGSGWETLSDVREASPDVRECLESPPVCPVVVGRPSRRSGIVRESLPYVRKAHLGVWERSGGPPKFLGVVGRPSRMFVRGQEALTDVRE